MQKGDYEKLSRIAPTVAQDEKYIDFGMPWEDQTLLVGKALGREEQAQKLIDDTAARFEQVRQGHPEFEGKTAILAYGGPDGYGAYSTQDTRSRFLTDLGFKTPAKIDELAASRSSPRSARSSSGSWTRTSSSCTARRRTFLPTRCSSA